MMERPCWRAFRNLSPRANGCLSAKDLAFQLVPRINAASRVSDPESALDYLLAPNDQAAETMLQALNDSNQERKAIEREMVDIAIPYLEENISPDTRSIVIGHSNFHVGVQGIVASRIVERFGLPTIVLSPMPGEQDILSGSARSVDGINLFSILQRIAKTDPEIFIGFGGHKEAAGMKVSRGKVDSLRANFEKIVSDDLGPGNKPIPKIVVDGCLKSKTLSLQTVEQIKCLEPYGQGFEEPVFTGGLRVVSCRAVGAEPVHLSLVLAAEDDVQFKAIWFRALQVPGNPLPVSEGDNVECIFSLQENRLNGSCELQLVLGACWKREEVFN